MRTGNLGVRFPADGTLIGVICDLGLAATGAPVLIDVLKNGVSIFGTVPQFAAGVGGVATFVPTDIDVLSTDRYTISILEVGSTTPGADLVVQMVMAVGT